MGFPTFQELESRLPQLLSNWGALLRIFTSWRLTEFSIKLKIPRFSKILLYNIREYDSNPILSGIFQVFLPHNSLIFIMHNFETSCRRNPRMSLPSFSPLPPHSFETKELDCDAYKTAAFLNFHDGGASVERIGVWITIEARERERESTRYARKIYPPVPGPIFWPTNAALRYQNLINNLRWKITGYFPPLGQRSTARSCLELDV